MDYTWYLFRFDGRINRARCWLALLIVICWMIFLSLVLFGVAYLFGATMTRAPTRSANSPPGGCGPM